MKAQDIILQVSHDLNDQEYGHEFTLWPQAMLMSYLYDAVIYLAPRFKKYFTTRQVVELQEGDNWQSACQCESIENVLGESNADGTEILHRLRRVQDDADIDIKWFGRAYCESRRDDDYEMREYVINETDDSMFRVIPPVPRGSKKKYYVLVECYKLPDNITSGYNVPDRFVPMVKQWMLGRAYAVDSENNTVVTEQSRQHMTIFMSLMDKEVQYNMMEREMKYGKDSVREVPDRAGQ